MKRLNSVAATQARLGDASRAHVYREMKNGRLRYVKSGRRTFIEDEAIEDYIELLRSEAESAGAA